MATESASADRNQRFLVTVDTVVFGTKDGRLCVLLVKRKASPYQGQWALPGGHVESDEDLNSAVQRELTEETGLSEVKLEQLGAFGDPDRDPRGRVISIAYVGYVDQATVDVQAATDAQTVQWCSVDDLPALAFDHRHIIKCALQQRQDTWAANGVRCG